MTTGSLVAVGTALKELVKSWQSELGIIDVFYGDQVLIPRTPAVCIEPTQKQREYAGVPYATQNTLEVALLIYFCVLGNSQEARMDCDALAEKIEAKLHLDKQLGGLVIQGHCTQIESGYAQKNNVVIVTSRILWQGLSKTQI